MLWRPSGRLCYKFKDDMLCIQRRSRYTSVESRRDRSPASRSGGGMYREMLDTGLLKVAIER
jgi:hypothetical protein